jgi:hypothetical protein
MPLLMVISYAFCVWVSALNPAGHRTQVDLAQEVLADDGEHVHLDRARRWLMDLRA